MIMAITLTSPSGLFLVTQLSCAKRFEEHGGWSKPWGAGGRECRMNEELTWQVRDAADERGSRQKTSPRACFYWKRDGQLVRSAEFTQSELEAEIERLSGDMAQFVIALKMLALSRGPR